MNFGDWLEVSAASWLGRPLAANDGVAKELVAAAEARMGFKVPTALRELYEKVGRVPKLMSSFQRFRSPQQWEVRDGRCLFLDENQGVCAWAVDVESSVWMLVGNEVHPENLTCEGFLKVLLPYQLAQGGFAYTGVAYTEPDDSYQVLEEVAATLGWPLVADHNGLKIYGEGGNLLWSLGPANSCVYLSSRDKVECDKIMDQIEFDEL